jgi:hypothetical protein
MLQRSSERELVVRGLARTCALIVLLTTSCAAWGETTPAPPPASSPSTSAAPVVGASSFASTGTLRFAQISDVHLFDAGYKCSGLYVQREYEENLNALRWSIDEVNRRWKSGDTIDFLVFTGDLGIVNLAGAPVTHTPPGADSKCRDVGDPASSYGPIVQLDFASAEAIVARLVDCLPTGVPIYFLPGNNDLTDEDPGTLSRYQQFVSGLRTLTHGRVMDLNDQAITARGYTLVGLDSAGFKPQNYSDSSSGAINESLIVSRGTTDSGHQTLYCNELKNGGSGSRADLKAKAVRAFTSLVSGPGPYLVFTHEPDLQDPFPARRLAEKASGGVCEFRSTWLLTEDARKAWIANGLDNPKIVGVFAGHFHADNPLQYGGPIFNSAVKAVYTTSLGTGKSGVRIGGLAPTFVTPPLAVKLQWANYPYGARGMMFVSVNNGAVSAQIDPYWTTLGSDCCGEAPSKLVANWLTVLKARPQFVFIIALFLTLILVLIVLLLAGELDPHCVAASTGKIWLIRWAKNRSACVKSTALKLMIDGETQSYSLSKMQFLLWTLASIYGYMYLWVAHTWVQGLPGLPDIADQFPWEISLSAGTAVAAQISQRVVGTKGGGPLKPQLSDLISAGGVIAPGRLQFFSWTLVAIAAYLSSILASDPCAAHSLPTIPPNLLLVSGLSSLTYLGARAVSAPGPVISSAQYVPVPAPVGTGSSATSGTVAGNPAGAAASAATAANGGLTGALTLLGSGFSRLAVVVLVADPTRGAAAANTASAGLAGPGVQTAGSGTSSSQVQLDMTKSDVMVTPPPYPVDPSFAVPGNPDYSTRLDVGVVSGLDPTKAYRIRVTNPDGKFGEGELTINATT